MTTFVAPGPNHSVDTIAREVTHGPESCASIVLDNSASGTDGRSFLLHAIAQSLCDGDACTTFYLFVAVAPVAAHLHASLRKLGAPIDAITSRFVTLDAVSGSSTVDVTLPNVDTAVLATAVQRHIEALPVAANVHMIVDDVPTLMRLSSDRRATLHWLRRSLASASGHSVWALDTGAGRGSTSHASGAGRHMRVTLRGAGEADLNVGGGSVACQRASDAAYTPVSLLRFLCACCDCMLALAQLNTGYSKDVHGRITLHRRPALAACGEVGVVAPSTWMRQSLLTALYRVTDARVKAVGDLTAVLT